MIQVSPTIDDMKQLIRSLLLMAAYVVAARLAFSAASLFWHPPAGVRFAFFLLLPPALWLPLILMDLLVDWALDPARWTVSFRGWWWFSAFFLASASGPWLLRKAGFKAIEGLTSVGWLLGAMLLTAVCRSAVNLAWPFEDPVGVSDSAGLTAVLLYMRLVLGDFIGMLILAPLVLMLVVQQPRQEDWRKWRYDLPLVLAPSLAVIAILVTSASDYQTYFFATGLSLIPAAYMAFRSGWRGASVALTSVSLIIAVAGYLNASPSATIESQFLIAAAGAAVLLLGAAVEALRDSQTKLHRRNLELIRANTQLDDLAGQLRETAQRNLALSENVRRWVTAELHDEIGQNLTALQLRLRVAETTDNRASAFEHMREIIAKMRRSVSGLLADLRPAGLDAFGLSRALQDGAIRRSVESAGLAFHVRIVDPSQVLAHMSNDNQTALYRMAQEAATNTIRHAQASRFELILRVRRVKGVKRVAMACIDDGLGFHGKTRTGGIGLQGIADRVASLGGRLRVRSSATGTRMIVALTLPTAAAD